MGIQEELGRTGPGSALSIAVAMLGLRLVGVVAAGREFFSTPVALPPARPGAVETQRQLARASAPSYDADELLFVIKDDEGNLRKY